MNALGIREGIWVECVIDVVVGVVFMVGGCSVGGVCDSGEWGGCIGECCVFVFGGYCIFGGAVLWVGEWVRVECVVDMVVDV